MSILDDPTVIDGTITLELIKKQYRKLDEFVKKEAETHNWSLDNIDEENHIVTYNGLKQIVNHLIGVKKSLEKNIAAQFETDAVSRYVINQYQRENEKNQHKIQLLERLLDHMCEEKYGKKFSRNGLNNMLIVQQTLPSFADLSIVGPPLDDSNEIPIKLDFNTKLKQ